MSTNNNCKKNCRSVEAEMNVKATASLQQEVEEELSAEDKSLAELLSQNETENEEKVHKWSDRSRTS